MSRHLDVVFLDIGGVIYDDAIYRHAVLRALRELGAGVGDEEYEREYERLRDAQSGSFRRALTERFLGPEASVDDVVERAGRHWQYPPEALLPDVASCLERLAGRYRLGVVANQLRTITETMRRDGIDRFFDVWAVSESVGLEKPDPELFRYALREAGCPPHRTAMVGDRLDYDVRPAKLLGMRTVWVLRGEAPRQPTPEQLAEPEAAVSGLDELPDVIEDLDAA